MAGELRRGLLGIMSQGKRHIKGGGGGGGGGGGERERE